METIIVTAVIVLAGTLEAFAGLYTAERLHRKDWIINLASLFHLAVLVKPAIIIGTAFILSALWPAAAGQLHDMPWWLGLLLVLLPSDLLHYLYHRLGHEWKTLFHIHRTHHVTSHMQVGAAFRENIFWYVFMPDLYYGAAMLYLGLGQQVAVAVTLTGIVNVINHVGLRWDLQLNLYERPIMRRIMWVMERILNLPDMHHAHHGLGRHQNLNGNYGQLLSIWDVIFKTARFPHHAQDRFGLNRGAETPICVQLYFPLCRPTDDSSPWARRRR